MTGDQLQAIAAQATSGRPLYTGPGDAITQSVVAAHGAALNSLANHATALVELVRACEQWRSTRASDVRALMDAVRGVDAALAAVHAVGGGT